MSLTAGHWGLGRTRTPAAWPRRQYRTLRTGRPGWRKRIWLFRVDVEPAHNLQGCAAKAMYCFTSLSAHHHHRPQWWLWVRLGAGGRPNAAGPQDEAFTRPAPAPGPPAKANGRLKKIPALQGRATREYVQRLGAGNCPALKAYRFVNIHLFFLFCFSGA